MRARSHLLTTLAVLPAFAFACGGSDDGGTSEEALEKRVKESANAIFQGEARDAYAAYSEECKDEVSLSEFRASLNIAAAFFEGFAGTKMEDLEVEEVKIRNFEDDSAEAPIVVRSKDKDADPSLFGDEDDYSRWEVEDGEWVIGDCSDMTFAGGDDDDIDVSDDDEEMPTSTSSNRTPTAVPTPAKKPKLGEKATSEVANYTVNAIQDNLPGTEFSKPEPGQRWVAFDVTIEANEKMSYGPFDFSIQSADQFVYETEFVSSEQPKPHLSSGDLGPGGTVRGWVFFEVPATAVLKELRATPDFGEPPVVIADLTQQ